MEGLTLKDNENARAAAGTAERAEQGTHGALVSCAQDTTGHGIGQVKIVTLLPHGENNAIPAKELAALVGAPSVRALQSLIARECEETDALILSTVRHGGGYFLPQLGAAGREEIYRFINTLDARARHTYLRLRAARRALAQIDGQEVLDDE